MGKTSKFILVVFLILACAGIGCAAHKYFNTPEKLTMKYVSKHMDASGKFEYRTNLNPEIKYDETGYNENAHAGLLYAMYQYETKTNDKSLKNKRILASDYFVKRFIKPQGNKMFAVASIRQDDNGENIYSVGSTGIAITALTNLYPEKQIDLRTLRGMGKYIVSMQNPDGSFRSFSPNAAPDMSNPDVNGEAAMGLLTLFETDPEITWVNSAKKALIYTATQRKGKKDLPFDQWTVIATQKLFAMPNNGLSDSERDLLLNNAEVFADTAIKKQVTDKGEAYAGSFTDDRKLGSVASVMEGLAAAYDCTPNIKLKKEIKNSLDLGIAFLAKYQIKSGSLAGGIPQDADWKNSTRKRHTEIKLDQVQHALSAFVQAK